MKNDLYFFWRKITYPFRNFVSRTLTCLAYCKFIWTEDYDWDWSSVVKLLVFKLRRVEKYQRNYGISTINNKIADELAEAIRRLNLVINEPFVYKFMENLDKKWGELHWEFLDCPDHPEYKQMKTWRDKVKGIRDEKLSTEDLQQQMKAEAFLINKITQRAFDYISKHIHNWWD